jgi:alpha-L-arabinofuranosidase
MLKINKISEEEYMLEFLEKRSLLKQYKKSKENILLWLHSWNKIWFREPKKEWIIYFRINRQFRALCRLSNTDELIVFDIDNHQK